MLSNLQLATLRQRVHRLKARRETLEDIAMRSHRMIAASLLARRFRRGGPVAYYLSIPSPKNSRHRYVRKADAEAISRDTDAWREFSQAMSEWVRVSAELERLLRRIGRGRCRTIQVGKGKGR